MVTPACRSMVPEARASEEGTPGHSITVPSLSRRTQRISYFCKVSFRAARSFARR